MLEINPEKKKKSDKNLLWEYLLKKSSEWLFRYKVLSRFPLEKLLRKKALTSDNILFLFFAQQSC